MQVTFYVSKEDFKIIDNAKKYNQSLSKTIIESLKYYDQLVTFVSNHDKKEGK